MIPHKELVSGRAKPRPNGRFIKASGPMAALSRPAPMAVLSRPAPMAALSRDAQWPVYQGQPLDLAFGGPPAIAPHKQFISGRPATVLIKAGPDG